MSLDLEYDYDVDSMDLNTRPALIPAGKYLAQAVSGEKKETRTGGKMLVLKFEIMDGDYAGSIITQRYNIVNDSQQTMLISQQQIGNLGQCVGVPRFRDAELLFFKPVIINVKISKDKSGQYSDSNEISYYESVDGAQPPQHPANSAPHPASNTNRAVPPSQQRAAAGGGSRPWDRR